MVEARIPGGQACCALINFARTSRQNRRARSSATAEKVLLIGAICAARVDRASDAAHSSIDPKSTPFWSASAASFDEFVEECGAFSPPGRRIIGSKFAGRAKIRPLPAALFLNCVFRRRHLIRAPRRVTAAAPYCRRLWPPQHAPPACHRVWRDPASSRTTVCRRWCARTCRHRRGRGHRCAPR